MCIIIRCDQPKCIKSAICEVHILDNEGEDHGSEWFCNEHSPSFNQIPSDDFRNTLIPIKTINYDFKRDN